MQTDTGSPGVTFYIAGNRVRAWSTIKFDPDEPEDSIMHEVGHHVFSNSIAGSTVALFDAATVRSFLNVFGTMPLNQNWNDEDTNQNNDIADLAANPDPLFPAVDDNGDTVNDRFRGFLRDYDLTSTAHAWIDCVTDFVYKGEDFRAKKASDATQGVLLRLMFDGVEFGGDGVSLLP